MNKPNKEELQKAAESITSGHLYRLESKEIRTVAQGLLDYIKMVEQAIDLPPQEHDYQWKIDAKALLAGEGEKR